MSGTTLSAVGFARAKPEKAEEFGALLVTIVERSREEEGWIQAWIHRDLADENLFVFYETWASTEDVARHLDQPYMKEFLANRLDYLQEDLRVHQLGLVGPLPAGASATPVTPVVSPVEPVPPVAAAEPVAAVEPVAATGPAEAVEAVEPTNPADLNQRYVDAYNARDIDGVLAVYAPGALAVWQPGQAVTAAEHRDTVVEFLARQPKLSAQVRETYIVEDTAALVVDWSLEVPDAPEISGTGRGLDVLRRNADGQWRYIITNPFGSL